MKNKLAIIVLILMAISLPIASRLIKQNQDNRNRAMELVPEIPCSKFYGCMRGLDAAPPSAVVLENDCSCPEIQTIGAINGACEMCKTTPTQAPEICVVPECPLPLMATCPEGVDCTTECNRYVCLPKASDPNPPVNPPIDPGPVKYWQCQLGKCVQLSETMCRLNPLSIDSKPCIVGEQCPVGYCDNVGSTEPPAPPVMCDGQVSGNTKCMGKSVIMKCNSSGQWVQDKDCAAEGANLVCSNGGCIEEMPEVGSCSVCKTVPNTKTEGDADCDTYVKNNDFEIWRREFVATVEPEGGWMADFECVDKISQPDIGDFEVWRRNYIKGLN